MNVVDCRKKVAVLMATYNGEKWLECQLRSILKQNNVNVTLFISDDRSTDNTIEVIKKFNRESTIRLLEPTCGFGSPASNFLRLFRDVDLDDFDYIFLSDQDDYWLPEKISSAIISMRHTGCDCYASNLVCTYDNGERKLLRKSFPQTHYDFMFQGASAGCTYGMTLSSASVIKQLVKDVDLNTFASNSHDWIIYAITRSYGYKWFIDSRSFIEYRQHANNAWGALGFGSYLKRLRMLRNGWYRNQILIIAALCNLDNRQSHVVQLLSSTRILDRCILFFRALTFRRRRSERVATAFMVLFGFI